MEKRVGALALQECGLNVIHSGNYAVHPAPHQVRLGWVDDQDDKAESKGTLRLK